MKQNSKTLLYFFIGSIVGATIFYLVTNYKIQKKTDTSTPVINSSNDNRNSTSTLSTDRPTTNYSSNSSIDQLTQENVVINYVKEHHELPNYYITKSEARKSGWVASQGNLCDALPGKAIGGDNFSNREGNLPKGEKYYEADVNYNCGRRNADRIVFTKNGDVYLTKDHYKSFQKQ